MKTIVTFFLMFALVFFSCKKDNPSPPTQTQTPAPVVSTCNVKVVTERFYNSASGVPSLGISNKDRKYLIDSAWLFTSVSKDSITVKCFKTDTLCAFFNGASEISNPDSINAVLYYYVNNTLIKKDSGWFMYNGSYKTGGMFLNPDTIYVSRYF
jgi:hypothetical protein